MSQIISLPQLAWFGPRPLELEMPDGWNLKVCRMLGHDAPALTGAEIGSALRHPVAVSPLSILARGKKQAVIIFDDISQQS